MSYIAEMQISPPARPTSSTTTVPLLRPVQRPAIIDAREMDGMDRHSRTIGQFRSRVAYSASVTRATRRKDVMTTSRRYHR